MNMKKLTTTGSFLVLNSFSMSVYSQSAVDAAVEEGIIGFFSAFALVLIIYGVIFVIKLFKGSDKNLESTSEQRNAFIRKKLLTSNTALFAAYPFGLVFFILYFFHNIIDITRSR